MGRMEYYLLAVNLIGFLMGILNILLYRHTLKARIDVLLVLISLAGGSAGVLLSILLFDRKPVKDNMLLRVFYVCVFVIQLLVLLLLRGHHGDALTFAFWEFFARHKQVLVYLGIINFVTFAAFAVDKVNAMRDGSRIRIVTLLGLAFLGGSVGALLGMYLLHHKTRKNYFTVGVPLIMVMQAAVLFYAMNAVW
jgi:uncharacterized membrane protein YsdA (DUF1294 family)